MRCTSHLLLILGIVPVAVWLGVSGLGWGPDAQFLSGTLHPTDPIGSASRGLVVVLTWLTTAVAGPPLIGGSLLWIGWRFLAERSANLGGSEPLPASASPRPHG